MEVMENREAIIAAAESALGKVAKDYRETYYAVRRHGLGMDWGVIEYIPTVMGDGMVVVLKYSSKVGNLTEYRIAESSPESAVDDFVFDLINGKANQQRADRDFTRYLEAIWWNCSDYLESSRVKEEKPTAKEYVVSYAYKEMGGRLSRPQLTQRYTNFSEAQCRAEELKRDEHKTTIYILPLYS